MILRTVLCYVVAMKPMYFVMKIIVTKPLNKEKKSHFFTWLSCWFVLGSLLLAKIFKLLKLSSFLGMLLAGIIIGPFALDLIDINILNISDDLRQIALIIILIRVREVVDSIEDWWLFLLMY